MCKGDSVSISLHLCNIVSFWITHSNSSMYSPVLNLCYLHALYTPEKSVNAPCTTLQTQTIFCYCCPDCSSCLAHLNSIGWATWKFLTTIKNTASSILLHNSGEISYKVTTFMTA